MPPSNEYLIMKVNACFQATAVGLNTLDRRGFATMVSGKNRRDQPDGLW
jgi:hypothetical protein